MRSATFTPASGRPERAREQYNQAALLDPTYVEPRANLAKAENDIPALQKLAAQYPDDALIPYYISLLYRKEGKTNRRWQPPNGPVRCRRTKARCFWPANSVWT